MKNPLVPLLPALFLLSGCAMFTAWKTIPPPGGCDECHTVPISSNWQVVYRAPNLTDERDRLAFQQQQTNMPQIGKPASSLEVRKIQDQRCFDCHRAPNPRHMEFKGRFHH